MLSFTSLTLWVLSWRLGLTDASATSGSPFLSASVNPDVSDTYDVNADYLIDNDPATCSSPFRNPDQPGSPVWITLELEENMEITQLDISIEGCMLSNSLIEICVFSPYQRRSSQSLCPRRAEQPEPQAMNGG